MNKDKLISVIVPIYKVEEYLRKSIESILNQTYKNLEIILIDDESPDNCGKICDEFAEKDPRIVVIHQKNTGVAGARNKGIQLAHGDYIGFVDPDDYADPYLFEKLYKEICDNSADIAICGYRTVGIRNKDYKLCNASWNKDDALQKLVENKVLTSHLWNKLFKKELFLDLEFELGKRYEDVRIIHKLFLRAKKVVAIEEILYDYYVREDSITGTTQYSNSQEFIDSLDLRCNDLKNTKVFSSAKIGEFCSIRRIIYEMVISNNYNENYYKNLLEKANNIYSDAKIEMSLLNRILAKIFLKAPYVYIGIRLFIEKIFKK